MTDGRASVRPSRRGSRRQARRGPINIPIAAARNNDFIKRRGQVCPDTRAVTLELCVAARLGGRTPYIFSPLGPPFCFVFPAAAAAAAAVRVAPFRGHVCRDPPVRLIDQTMPPLLGVINYPGATRDVRSSKRSSRLNKTSLPRRGTIYCRWRCKMYNSIRCIVRGSTTRRAGRTESARIADRTKNRPIFYCDYRRITCPVSMVGWFDTRDSTQFKSPVKI